MRIAPQMGQGVRESATFQGVSHLWESKMSEGIGKSG